MSRATVLKINQRLFRGPLWEHDVTPPEGRWSDDPRDIPPAENGFGEIDEIRLIHTNNVSLGLQQMSTTAKVNLMIVAGSCMNSFPIVDLPADIAPKLACAPAYKPHLDEPWRQKKPWRR